MSVSLEAQLTIALQIILAGILSGLIGMDRERRGHDAGLRPHMLVGMGSCLFTGLSVLAFPGGDPGRVASQILPGLGFLGAGAILKQGANIQGLTTAASMWVTAAVGMGVGTGAWFAAICGTIIIWFTLVIVQRMKPDDLNSKRH
ncbi:MAG: MgtC/SapB family protein [Anaerolineae bacterium]|nr:MgtC/SapB family protein [Anaerolineae bacterium]